jgi:hypothetical protein
MNQYVLDTYVRSQGVYRMEYLEFQVEQDPAFQERNMSLEKLIHISDEEGYEDLKNMLGYWFESSNITEEDVMEYMFMKAHPELFEYVD